MNKLPNTVVAFAPPGWAYSPTVCAGRPMTNRIRRDAGALVCRWQRDPVSHQLRAPGASKTLNANSKRGRDYVSQDKEFRYERWTQ